MRGGTSELAAPLQRTNKALELVLDAFAEAAFDHTGTFPFVLAGRDSGRRCGSDLREAGGLYIVLHDQGEPWFEVGIDVVSGARAYAHPSMSAEPYDGDPDTLMDAIRAPEGHVLHAENW